jgi:hypothetical protein
MDRVGGGVAEVGDGDGREWFVGFWVCGIVVRGTDAGGGGGALGTVPWLWDGMVDTKSSTVFV